MNLSKSATCGFTGAVDGDYGPATEAKVRDVQRLFKLTPDGIAGRQTRAVVDLLWLGRFGSVPT